MLFMQSVDTKTEDKKEALRKDIKNLEKMMQENEGIFNMTENDTLIEFAIYQDIALKAKYSYLLQCFKKMD